MQRDLCWELLIELTFPSAPGNGEATAQAACNLQGGGFYFSINAYRFKDFICPWTASPFFNSNSKQIWCDTVPAPFAQQLFIVLSSWCRAPTHASHRLSGPRACAAGWRAQQEGWGRWKEAGRVSGLGRWGKSHPWLLPWHASCTQTCSSAAAVQRGRGWLWLWAGARGCSLEQSNMGGVFAPEAGELRAERSVRCFLIKLSYNVPSDTKAQVIAFSITSSSHLLLEWGKTANKIPSHLWWLFLWTLVQVSTKHGAALPMLGQSPTRKKATQRRAQPWEHLSPCWLCLANTQ